MKTYFIYINNDLENNLEETNKTFQDELTQDLISIIQHFSMKLYSNRRKKFKDIEKLISDQNKPV